MDAGMDGTCVVVTGAGGGIGSCLSRQLVERGARVALLGRTKETLEAVCRSVDGPGQWAVWPCDVREPEQIDAVIQNVEKEFGPVDVLVNNAAAARLRSLSECTLGDMREMYETNVFGVFNCTKALLPRFLARGRGHIITVDSMSAVFGLPGFTAYAGTKAAVARMNEVWRRELREQDIKVSTIYPYYVATTMALPTEGPDPVVVRFPVVPIQSPRRVARAIVRAIEHPKAEVWVPKYLRFMMWLPVLAPGLGDVLARVFPHGKPEHWRPE